MDSLSHLESTGRIDQIKEQLRRLHSCEKFVYAVCDSMCNGNGCTIKVWLRDGRITAIEPDDRSGRGIGIEDKAMLDEDLMKNRIQHRGCPIAWVWHRHLHHSNRVLYPLKKADGTRRGEGKFQRISWDEALTTIAEKMKYFKEKYGPYSILTPYWENPHLDNLFSWFGAGVQGWGWCSWDAERLAQHLMSGYPGWEPSPTSNMADILFNSRMIVIWGLDPTVTHLGTGHQYAYYIKMARERGTPVICIDPRYTAGAEVISDQWIPIKPGTDMAMMLAIAYVLVKEDLYNKEFVERFVEPKGFKIWCDYVMGVTDGIKKTPQWAERICAVPARTIVKFSELYAKMKPTFLHKSWSVSRKSFGENSARAAAALQAMMGYIGGPGGYSTWAPSGRNPKTAMRVPMGLSTKKYSAPRMYRSNKWAQAVLLLDKVDSGEMSTNEYRRIIGWRCDQTLPNPTPKMLMPGSLRPFGSNPLVTSADSTEDQLRAIEKLEFVVAMSGHMVTTAKYADIVLPVADPPLEDTGIRHTYDHGFSILSYSPGVVKPNCEARSHLWIYTKLAEKLGFARLYNSFYTVDENWDADQRRYHQAVYGKACEELSKQSITIPDWEEFEKTRIVNLDEYYGKPLSGFHKEIEEGAPFPTKSGKIEFYSEIIGDESRRENVHFDHAGRLIDNLPNDWRELQPIPVYQPMVGGFEDPNVSKHPLLMLTPHPRYRSHSTFWDNQWLRGDVYRHTIWISATDANTRGIKDGDLVRVHNYVGATVLPAYVTARIAPGVAIIHHGGWYEPNNVGIDQGGCPSLLLHDEKSPMTPAHVTALVEVEKYQ